MKTLKDLSLAIAGLIACAVGWGLLLIIAGISAKIIVWAYNLI